MLDSVAHKNFDAQPDTPWHVLTVDEAAEKLDATLLGLTTDEATQRLLEVGPNELLASGRVSPWTILLEQFKNVLIIILLAATTLSAFLGHGIEAIAITVIVLFAVVLGFWQEYRAERAIEALREMAAPAATVIRDGREQRLPARDLVPGDIILLATGDKVPADARLAEAVNLQTVEAALTGESAPIEKHSSPLEDQQLSTGDRINMAYAGTAVTYGRGRALVVATGMATEFGKIARMLETVETAKTPLQNNLDRIGKSLA
ncbi:MAG: HAD-IC family P-type ATPase, partial [Pyrinomonadaceae bacterium]